MAWMLFDWIKDRVTVYLWLAMLFCVKFVLVRGVELLTMVMTKCGGASCLINRTG